MYIPTAHRINDLNLIRDLIRRYPFAILITVVDGIPVATHLPILLEQDEPISLAGHLARQNQHWKALEGSESLIIFSGPHGYVSPTFYESNPNVPTWNYISIHVYGKVVLIENDDEVLAHLESMVTTLDPDLASVDPASTDSEHYRRMMPGIVAFRMFPAKIEGKAKLNKNKSEQDRLAVRARYLESDSEDERAMGRLMPEVRHEN